MKPSTTPQQYHTYAYRVHRTSANLEWYGARHGRWCVVMSVTGPRVWGGVVWCVVTSMVAQVASIRVTRGEAYVWDGVEDGARRGASCGHGCGMVTW